MPVLGAPRLNQDRRSLRRKRTPLCPCSFVNGILWACTILWIVRTEQSRSPAAPSMSSTAPFHLLILASSCSCSFTLSLSRCSSLCSPSVCEPLVARGMACGLARAQRRAYALVASGSMIPCWRTLWTSGVMFPSPFRGLNPGISLTFPMGSSINCALPDRPFVFDMAYRPFLTVAAPCGHDLTSAAAHAAAGYDRLPLRGDARPTPARGG